MSLQKRELIVLIRLMLRTSFKEARFVLLLTLFLASLCFVAGAVATSAPVLHLSEPLRQSADAAPITEFDVNGLKVLVKRRTASQTVAAGLFIRGGSSNITAENAGIEALMLATSTVASEKYPRSKMRDELARLGSDLGSGVNYDYSALTLASTRSNFDHSFDIFTDVILHPLFDKQDFDLVKNRLIVSLNDDQDTPDSYLQNLQSAIAYAGHPYANDPGGTSVSMSRLNLEDARNYHKHLMETSRLLLVIVGNLSPQDLRVKITETLGKLPRGNYQPVQPPALKFDASTIDVTSRMLPTNYVNGFFVAPALTSPDIYPMRIASSILRDRIFDEVRAKRNLSYAPDAFLRSQGANVGGLYVTAVDANQAVGLMLNEITRLQTEQVAPQLITSIVAQFLTNYYLGQETNAAQAGELARFELIGGGWRKSLEFFDRLRAVTPADIERVARTYMRNIRFVVLGDPSKIDHNVFTRSTSGASTGY